MGRRLVVAIGIVLALAPAIPEAVGRPRVPDPVAVPLRVCLDPGHGGLSTGAMGTAGIYEKHVTLALARKVQALLQGEPGVSVVMTREDDADLDLPSRPIRAGALGADIFVSLHGNASPAVEARGIETFYLGAASDPGADEVSRRENAEAVTPEPLADDPAVAAILSDLRRNGNLSESALLAEAIHNRLSAACSDTPSRKVRQGNFAVLRRASMPAVVVEVGFLTHPVEGLRLVQPAYQDRLAAAIRDGILAFARRTAPERAALVR
jgi:N-acetylmuramoyl-L-alanine amidase